MILFHKIRLSYRSVFGPSETFFTLCPSFCCFRFDKFRFCSSDVLDSGGKEAAFSF